MILNSYIFLIIYKLVISISVHPTDATRLDLIIPGEAHFYVKAATPQERQQWLVALGSSKAGLAAPNGVPRQMSGDWFN